MKIGMRVLSGFIALAMLAQSASAAIDLAMADIVTLPGNTSVTGVLTIAGGTDISDLDVALSVADMMPNTGAAVISGVAVGPIWPAHTSGAQPSVFPLTQTVYSTSTNPQVAFNSAGTALLVTFDVTGAEVGDVFQVSLNQQGFSAAFDNTLAVADRELTPMMTFNGVAGSPGAFTKITVVPEPSSFILLGLIGGVGVAGNWVRKRFTKIEA